MAKAPLSVILPAYNEEKNIEGCLESVSWADEIIVVDGGSTDRTREIASRYTPNVLVTENAPAETQRLKALERIRHEWFFLIDADERVSPELRQDIERVLGSQGSHPAYRVLRRNFHRARPVHLHHPDYQLRLFRKDAAARLPERIHRIPEVADAGTLGGVLIHHFFTTFKDYFGKLDRYTAIEASYWREERRKVGGLNLFYYFLFRPAARFLQYYFLKKGCLDGFFGLFYSLASAYYDWKVAARVLSVSRGK
jgi:glycosyltransferase involved in cell wall biosynthesis